MLIDILVILLLILLNGLFAMAELALVSARLVRLRKAAAEGDRGAARAAVLAEQPGRFLSTTQIGITLIGVLTGAVGSATLSTQLGAMLRGWPALAPWADAAAFAIVVVLITFVSLVLGELVPKQLALSRPEWLAARVARPMALLSTLVSPAGWVLSATSGAVLRLFPAPPEKRGGTDEEVRLLLEEGLAAGHVHPTEKQIVDRTLRLAERRVAALMTPRPQVEWLDLDDPPEALRRQIIASRYSRFPVGHRETREVAGVVETGNLVKAALAEPPAPLDIRAAIRPALYIPDSATVLAALETFRQSGAGIALVIDEYGEFQGVLTPGDLLETLVGEMAHPGDPVESPIVAREDGSWLVDGTVPVEELQDAIGLGALPEPRGYDTAAGLVLDRLRRVPRPADSFELTGFRFEVVDMDGRRVDKILVSRL
ncbi:MAG: hemolysin family protein [Dongiaceae bacterium]